jgi:beta-xylosidase
METDDVRRAPCATRAPGPGRTARLPGAILALLVCAWLLAGCSDAAPTITPGPTAAATTAPATATEAPTGATAAPATATGALATATEASAASPTGSAAAAPSGPTYQNPVLQSDFPDPSVLHAGDAYYAYATNGSGANVQRAKSTDLVHWQMLGDAMPSLPSWAQLGGSFVWAPEVIPVADHYVMYYTARDTASDKQCVGVAVGATPDGHFKDSNDHPLVCQADLGGTIDPSPFRDGDKLYLYFKNDGNCCGITTRIYAQELSADGLQLQGTPTALIENNEFWEGQVIEAPTMFKHDTGYYLFFSANDYAGANYAVGYATCDTPTGPCTQAAENPILKSQMTEPLVIGPGHQALLQVGDQTWIIYHSWEMVNGLRGDRRFMSIDRVNWKDGKPVVQGPTTSPQPAP